MGITHTIFSGTKYETTTKRVATPESITETKTVEVKKTPSGFEELWGKYATPGYSSKGAVSSIDRLYASETEKPVVSTVWWAEQANAFNEVIGGYTEKAYKAVGSSGLPDKVKYYGNVEIGAVSAFASIVPFFFNLPVALEWIGMQPGRAPEKAINIGTDMVTSLYETDREYPGSFIGTVAGMYASGKVMEYGATKVGAGIGVLEKGALKTTGLMKEMVYPRLNAIFTGDAELKTLNTRLGASTLRDYFGKSEVVLTRAEPESFSSPNLKRAAAGEPATPFKTALGTLNEADLA